MQEAPFTCTDPATVSLAEETHSTLSVSFVCSVAVICLVWPLCFVCVCVRVCVCVGEHVFSDFPALATREIRLLQEWRGVGMGG